MDFADTTILCVGDLMLDRFVYADMERISPEAPVPILRLKETREMLGGAGNVANNIASLGGRAILVGMLGKDAAGERLRQLIANTSGVVPGHIATDARPTICKTRYFASSQQVVRTDEESQLPLTTSEESSLLASIRAHITIAHAVVLSDYGKGVLNRATISHIIAIAKAAGIPIFVDPKSKDFSLYRGATCITPNLKELAAASGHSVDDEEHIVRAARRVLADAEATAILATRSEKGMMLIEATGDVHSVPARAREVYDVSGAGDTVIATMALCYAGGRSLSQAMHVANAAASIVVSKLGTASVSIAEVMHELAAQDERGADVTVNGLRSHDQAQVLVSQWKAQGLVVGFTNGCFDVLHAGHISLLAQARKECDRLIVGLNSDASVRGLKGPARPINTLSARAQVIAAVRHVDCVVSFDAETPIVIIKALLPNVLIKGGDYSIDSVVGADLVQAAGGRVVLARFVTGQSSSGIISRIREVT